MEKFDLSLWLQDKSRKVIDDDGFPVEIIKWDANEKYPVVYLNHNGIAYNVSVDGMIDFSPNHGLFFADEELTEFDYAVLSIISDHNSHKDSIEAFAKRSSKKLLDLARKELQPEFDKEMDKMLAETDKVIYQKGQQDALKDLPKWKKGNDGEFLYETSIVWTHNETKTLATAGLRLDSNTFYIPISELEKLSKEE